MGLKNEDFSDEDHCQCMYTWEFFTYFLWYNEHSHPENPHPENFHQSNSPLVNYPTPWKIPNQKKFLHGIFRPVFLNIPTRVFYYYFFSLLLALLLILLKRVFCNSMLQKWSLYVCQNLSKQSVKWRKGINEMGGNIPVQVRIF